MKKTADKNPEMRAYVRGLPGFAAYMDIPLDTVKKKWRTWASDGQIEWPSVIGRNKYFRKASLDRFFEMNRLVKKG